MELLHITCLEGNTKAFAQKCYNTYPLEDLMQLHFYLDRSNIDSHENKKGFVIDQHCSSNNILAMQWYEAIEAAYADKAREFIIRCRTKLGFTQQELALKIGWSTYKNISNIERGTHTPSYQTVLSVECLMRRNISPDILRRFMSE